LDDVALNKIKSFETGLLDFVKSNHSDLIDKIQSSGKLEADDEEQLNKIITNFKKETFKN